VVTSNPPLPCNMIRLVLIGAALVLWAAITAFSQDGKAPSYNGRLTSQASPEAKCPPKPAVGSAQAAVPAEPSTKIKPENLSLRVADDSRESDGAEGGVVHEKPLSTTVEYLTKDSKKPAQCEAKTAAASYSR
jgi:hypothetical protein